MSQYTSSLNLPPRRQLMEGLATLWPSSAVFTSVYSLLDSRQMPGWYSCPGKQFYKFFFFSAVQALMHGKYDWNLLFNTVRFAKCFQNTSKTGDVLNVQFLLFSNCRKWWCKGLFCKTMSFCGVAEQRTFPFGCSLMLLFDNSALLQFTACPCSICSIKHDSHGQVCNETANSRLGVAGAFGFRASPVSLIVFPCGVRNNSALQWF